MPPAIYVYGEHCNDIDKYRLRLGLFPLDSKWAIGSNSFVPANK